MDPQLIVHIILIVAHTIYSFGVLFLASYLIFSLSAKYKKLNEALPSIFELSQKVPVLNKVKNPYGEAFLSGLCLITLSAGMLIVLTHLSSWIGLIYMINIFVYLYVFISRSQIFEQGVLKELKPVTRWLIQLDATLVISSLWLLTPSWLSYDVVFLPLAIVVLCMNSKPVKLHSLIIVFSMMVLFDIWGVIVSGKILELVKMMTVKPPVLLYVPDPGTFFLTPLSGLGMGDIIIAGVMISSATKLDLRKYAITGYGIGLFLIILISFTLGAPLPALTTIVPCILLSIAWGGRDRLALKIKNLFTRLTTRFRFSF